MKLRKRVLIVGGGASGTLLAIQLLKKAKESKIALDLFLVEKTGKFGPGIAYGTPIPVHLLNVPAGQMAAFPQEPSHFLSWLKSRVPDVNPTSFVPRHLFGEYLAELLAFEEKNLQPQVHFQRIKDEAISAAIDDHGRGLVGFNKTASLQADAVILAIGNLPPGLHSPFLGFLEKSDRYVSNLWTSKTLPIRNHSENILIVGTGLTMVDAAVAFKAQGHKGKIFALSRRGLLSTTHQLHPPYPLFLTPETLPRTVLGLLKKVRQEVAKAHSQGVDWRPVVDSLRGVTQVIWKNFSLPEKRRFLRHVRPYWDIHRHRMAPKISESVQEMIQTGQLTLLQGRISKMKEGSEGFAVEYVSKGKLERMPEAVKWVVNCTGPECDYRKREDPLVNDLVRQQLARPDALGMGLEVDKDGRILELDGRASKTFYGIGPIRKGDLWETTAIPEIGVQASEISDLLLG